MARRQRTIRYVSRRTRVYRVVTKKVRVMQCEPPYVLFGECVRQLRMKRGWTQQQLADKLKMARASIANIEVGRQRVLLSDVFDFAKALQVEPTRMFAAVAAFNKH